MAVHDDLAEIHLAHQKLVAKQCVVFDIVPTLDIYFLNGSFGESLPFFFFPPAYAWRSNQGVVKILIVANQESFS